MPTRQDGNSAKNASTFPRRSFRRSTTPFTMGWTWNTVPARSVPIGRNIHCGPFPLSGVQNIDSIAGALDAEKGASIPSEEICFELSGVLDPRADSISSSRFISCGGEMPQPLG